MKLYHLNILATKADRDELNLKGWDGHPRFLRHLDITSAAKVAAAAEAWLQGEYKLVADIDTQELPYPFEWAFTHTQNLSELGWANEARAEAGRDIFEAGLARINPVIDSCDQTDIRYRSTSVGDIWVNGEDVFLILPTGMTRLEVEA